MRYGNRRISEGAILLLLGMLLSMPALMYVMFEAVIDKIEPNQIFTVKERAEIAKKKGK